jgi:hypothetical protein
MARQPVKRWGSFSEMLQKAYRYAQSPALALHLQISTDSLKDSACKAESQALQKLLI